MTKYGVRTFGISKVAISQNRPCQISPFQWLVLSSRRPAEFVKNFETPAGIFY
jgi:hypothetical protein